MECKKCGNKLTKDTFWVRCGTENSEEVINNQLKSIEEEDKKVKSKTSTQITKLYIIIAIILIIIIIIGHFYDESFNSCVKKNGGHHECGLGTLCDHKCMPPFYFLVELLSTVSAVILVWVSLVFPIFYLYKKKKEKSRN